MTSQPAVYTSGHHAPVLRSHNWRTAANSAGYLLGALQPHMRILDVGCGPGTITTDLAALVPEGEAIGLEPVAAVLEGARAAAAERGVANVSFELGDVHRLPYADGAFDVVHAHQVLQHAGDAVHALREMRRVARRGGLVAVREADFGAITWFPPVRGLDEWRDVWTAVARANGGEPHAGRRLLSWALQAGFARECVACSASAWCYSTPEERAWWGNLWAERTLLPQYVESAVAKGLATEEKLRGIADAWREWATKEDAYYGMPHSEILARVV